VVTNGDETNDAKPDHAKVLENKPVQRLLAILLALLCVVIYAVLFVHVFTAGANADGLKLLAGYASLLFALVGLGMLVKWKSVWRLNSALNSRTGVDS
jgi:membrane protein YdbS with pleckstrin-like domain